MRTLIYHSRGRRGARRGEAQLDASRASVEPAHASQGEAARACRPRRRQCAAAAPRREATARRAAAPSVARDALDREEKRAASAGRELTERLAQSRRPRARTRADRRRRGVLAASTRRRGELNAAAPEAAPRPARAAAREAEAALASGRRELAEAQDSPRRRRRRADAASSKRTLARGTRARLGRSETELDIIAAERDARWRAAAPARTARVEAARSRRSAAAAASKRRSASREAAHAQARAKRSGRARKLTGSRRKAQKLDTEAQTLSKLLNAASGGFGPASTEESASPSGFEAALGAALGDDLDAPDQSVGARPLGLRPTRRGDPRPAARAPNRSPPSSRRRLRSRAGSSRSALVPRRRGRRTLRPAQPGQRLVTKEGDLWRWDGFVSAADAPTPPRTGSPSATALAVSSVEADAARQAPTRLKAEAEPRKAAAAPAPPRKARRAQP